MGRPPGDLVLGELFCTGASLPGRATQRVAPIRRNGKTTGVLVVKLGPRSWIENARTARAIITTANTVTESTSGQSSRRPIRASPGWRLRRYAAAGQHDPADGVHPVADGIDPRQNGQPAGRLAGRRAGQEEHRHHQEAHHHLEALHAPHSGGDHSPARWSAKAVRNTAGNNSMNASGVRAARRRTVPQQDQQPLRHRGRAAAQRLAQATARAPDRRPRSRAGTRTRGPRRSRPPRRGREQHRHRR